MANADDSPPSESGEGDGQEDSSSKQRGLAEASSEPEAPEPAGASDADGEADGDESGFSLPDLGTSSVAESQSGESEDSGSSGFSLPDPSSVVEASESGGDSDPNEASGGSEGAVDEETDAGEAQLEETLEPVDDREEGGGEPESETSFGLEGVDAGRLGVEETSPEVVEEESAGENPPHEEASEPIDDEEGFDVPETEIAEVSAGPPDDEDPDASSEEASAGPDGVAGEPPVAQVEGREEQVDGGDSSGSVDDEAPEASDESEGDGRAVQASSALSEVADEMARSEADSGVHEEPEFRADSDAPTGSFEHDEATVVSEPGFEGEPSGQRDSSESASGSTIEAAAPHLAREESDPQPDRSADSPPPGQPGSERREGDEPSESSASAPDSSPSRSPTGTLTHNPPTPEQTGRASDGARKGPDPTAEVVQPDLEPDDEFESQETDLFDSPFENDPLYPRITILDGPSAGQEFLLNKLRNSIGRATSNTVTIPDQAMSRQHLEIVQNPDETYTIKDLQSVNGTFLNGTKIREADLFHGDRIEVGKTTFQFGIPGQRTSSEERQRRLVRAPHDRPDEEHPHEHPTAAPIDDDAEEDALTRWLNRIIVGALVALVPLAASFAYLTLSNPEGSRSDAEARRARTAYLAGVDAVKRRDWEKAREKFERARSLDPDLERVAEQLERLETEREAQRALDEARAALDQGERERALRLAESVPRRSVYYEDARQIVRREKRKKRISSLYRRADQEFDDGRHQAALATLQRVLQTNPNHERALELRRRILDETQADLEEAKKEAEAEEREREQKRRTKRRRQRQPRGQESGRGAAAEQSDGQGSDQEESWLIDDAADDSEEESAEETAEQGGRRVNFTKGFALYQREEFEAAIAHFERAAEQSDGAVGERAAAAAEGIRKFRDHYRAGRRALASEKWAKATEQFQSALTVDEKVADAAYFRDELTQNLASARAGLGLRRAERGDYTAAFEVYQKARRAEASNARVRELGRRLENRAQSLYIKAAAKRKTDPQEAASLCRKITSIVPEDNEHHEKARQILEEL